MELVAEFGGFACVLNVVFINKFVEIWVTVTTGTIRLRY